MKSDRDPTQEEVRNWLRGLLDRAKLTGHALEKRAGLGRGTLTRFLNQPVKHVLSHRTMIQAAAAAGESMPFKDGAGTNVDLLHIALSDARLLLDRRLDPDYSHREAQTAAHIYDVLIETARAGGDIDQARQTLQTSFRRASRHIPR